MDTSKTKFLLIKVVSAEIESRCSWEAEAPYAQLEIADIKKKSDTAYFTNHPKWDNVLKFNIYPHSKGEKNLLKISLLDEASFRTYGQLYVDGREIFSLAEKGEEKTFDLEPTITYYVNDNSINLKFSFSAC